MADLTEVQSSQAVKLAVSSSVGAETAFVTGALIDSTNNYYGQHILQPDRNSASGSLNALDAAVSISMEGKNSASFKIAAGTLSATLVVEQSTDEGTSWEPARIFEPENQAALDSLTLTNPNATHSYGIFSMQGISHVRVRVSAYTSGSATATLRATHTSGVQNSLDPDQTDIDANRTFCFAIDTLNAATAGTNNPLILLRNPSTSTKRVYLKSIISGTTITNVGVAFNVYSGPTVTANGTAQTAVARSLGSGATAQLLINTLPTVSANGTLISAFQNAQNSNSVQIIETNRLKMAPNTSILITGNPTSNNRNTIHTIVWAEA